MVALELTVDNTVIIIISGYIQTTATKVSRQRDGDSTKQNMQSNAKFFKSVA